MGCASVLVSSLLSLLLLYGVCTLCRLWRSLALIYLRGGREEPALGQPEPLRDCQELSWVSAGTAPAPRTCSQQQFVVPDTQGCGGDEGQEEQQEQHHGHDDEPALTAPGGEKGVSTVGWFNSPSPKTGTGTGFVGSPPALGRTVWFSCKISCRILHL